MCITLPNEYFPFENSQIFPAPTPAAELLADFLRTL